MADFMVIVGTIAFILIVSYIIAKATCGISLKKIPPCVECKHYRGDKYSTYLHYCDARVNEISGQPQSCTVVRDTFSCKFEPKE